MKILLLLLILLGMLAALVFGILWIVSLFTYINHQPARLIRNAFIALAVVALATAGLGMADSEETEPAQQLAEENAELKAQLDGLQEKLTELATENEMLKSGQEEMEAEYDVLRTEVTKYAAAAEQVAAAKTILANEKEALLAEVTALTQQLAEAEFERGLLLEEVASLETALTVSRETETRSAAVPGAEAAAIMAEPSAAASSEEFANCTELKTVYPGGVGSDHAAYQSGMDRDKDGWACE